MSTRHPRVSVALATFNGERYLQDQLESIRSQTRPPDELVACDDASTDRTTGILHAFAAGASFPVRVYTHNINLGYASTFERALARCRGDVIFLCDQDDVWYQYKIAHVLKVFRERPAVHVLIHDANVVNDRLEPATGERNKSLMASRMNDRAYILGCCTAMRSQFRQLVLPIPTGVYAHDGWIHALSYALGVRYFCPTPLQYFRRHDLNASTNPDVMNRYATKPQWPDQMELQINRLNAILGRLEKHHDLALHCASSFAYQRSLNSLHLRIAQMQSRSKLVRRGHAARFFGAINLWLKGSYSTSQGLRSFLRDVLWDTPIGRLRSASRLHRRTRS